MAARQWVSNGVPSPCGKISQITWPSTSLRETPKYSSAARLKTT